MFSDVAEQVLYRLVAVLQDGAIDRRAEVEVVVEYHFLWIKADVFQRLRANLITLHQMINESVFQEMVLVATLPSLQCLHEVLGCVQAYVAKTLSEQQLLARKEVGLNEALK